MESLGCLFFRERESATLGFRKISEGEYLDINLNMHIYVYIYIHII